MSGSPNSQRSARSNGNLQNQPEFTGNGQLIAKETKQELTRVSSFLSQIYSVMYPRRNHDESRGWVRGIVQSYKDFRTYREKPINQGGRGVKEGMRHISMPLVISNIIYCDFAMTPSIGPIPAPILIHLINKAIDSSHEKNPPKKITLKDFETYRTRRDPKGPGLMQFIRTRMPNCYKDFSLYDQIGFSARVLMNFDECTVRECKKLANAIEIVQSKTCRLFNNNTPRHKIVIACLLLFDKRNIDIKATFGETKTSIEKVIQTIKNSEDPKIKAALKNIPKKSPKASKKKTPK